MIYGVSNAGDDGVISAARGLWMPEPYEITLRSDRVDIVKPDQRAEISSPKQDLEQYLSDLRIYNGMLGEVFAALHDTFANTGSTLKVEECMLGLHQRVLDEFDVLQKGLKTRSIIHLLDYELHKGMLSILEQPLKAHENPKDREVRQLVQLASLLTKQSNLALDERVTSNVNIREVPSYKLLPHSTELETLVEINRTLTIDTEKQEPQSGFGRVLERAELEKALRAEGARLFLLEFEGQVAGYYILHTSLESVSTQVSLALKSLKCLGANPSRCGWADIVGILPEARKYIESSCKGIKAYDLLDAAVVQSARAHGLEILFGEVREGAQGNLAKSSHLRCGWQETGIIYQGKLYPYQILRREL